MKDDELGNIAWMNRSLWDSETPLCGQSRLNQCKISFSKLTDRFCYVNFHYFDEDTMPSAHHKKAEQIDKSSQPLLAIADDHAPRSYQIRMAIVNLIDGLSVCQWTRQCISNKKLCSHQQKCKWTRLARGNKLHPFDVIIIYYVVYALLCRVMGKMICWRGHVLLLLPLSSLLTRHMDSL